MKVVLELQREGGPEAVTLARVSEGSGVSIGSIYHQFGDKDGLLDASFEALIADYRTHLLAFVKREGRTARQYVRAVVTGHLTWVFEHPDEARTLFRKRREVPPERDAAVRRSTGAFGAELLGGLRKVARAGEVVPLEGALAAAVVLGPAHEISRQWLEGRLPDLEQDEAIRSLAHAAWRAVKAD